MTMWALWHGRNRLVFEGIREDPVDVADVVTRGAHLWSVVVEGDSVEVINVLNSAASLVNSLGLLVKDIYDASRLFKEVTFSHAQHEANEVAHGLARHAEKY
ncbi:hypothetical protein L1049_011259 [Liquidambar formosana]|uniref:RNase H type-1 domain-containing protein n=1 Tax=Liquidambar formosana TaxID=63359 RepID=A0AAP0WZM9_LIQFO